MAERVVISGERFLDRKGTCRSCGTRDYTVRELTLHEGQAFRCYWCFDKERGVNRF